MIRGYAVNMTTAANDTNDTMCTSVSDAPDVTNSSSTVLTGYWLRRLRIAHVPAPSRPEEMSEQL